MNPRKALSAGLFFAVSWCSSAGAAELINTQSGGIFSHSTGVAIMGYDPVAYFTDSRPVKGSEKFVYVWKAAKWEFASQEHLDKFRADPEKFAPQYGGYCAYGVAKDNLIEIDPNAWTVLDGKLYLNYTSDTQKKWLVDKPGFIKQADAKFPDLVKK